MKYDVIIVGAGFAGATLANLYNKDNKKVLVIEKRSHIGGNMYDYYDESKVLYHEYGPHIFHTGSKEVVDYLSQFTEWFDYEHRVLGYVKDQYIPIPFNFKSIDLCFDEDKAQMLKEALLKDHKEGTKVPILRLRESENADIRELAEFIYENVFKFYTMKQWGLTPEEIDPAVTARVPVLLGYDDRYFQVKYQMMPQKGYTNIFENMLKGIEVRLNCDCKNLLKFENGNIMFENNKFDGEVIYTGALDELFDYKFGDLPYRSLKFDKQTHDGDYQPATTVNYPGPEAIYPYTRITEYKKMMFNPPIDKTTIAVEYPKAYDRFTNDIPYYPIFTETNQKQYQQYVEEVKKYSQLHIIGRLAEYKYYDMDAIVMRALRLYNELTNIA